MPVRKAVGTIPSSRSRRKRTSAVTWLVFIAMTIVAGMIFFMHSDVSIVYQDLSNTIKFSTDHIPLLRHTYGESPNTTFKTGNSNLRHVTTSPSYESSAIIIPPRSVQPIQLRKRIAFAITITKDGSFQDGAAVMQYSIIKAFGDDDIDISFVAFVHPNVTTSRPSLRKIGYRCLSFSNLANLFA